jgi:zinc transport system permease protein
VALCTRALGALPVFAFSVLPAMTALVLTSRLGAVFAVATVLGALSGVVGYGVSFRAELPVGATQSALAAALFAAALVYRLLARRLTSPRRGA